VDTTLLNTSFTAIAERTMDGRCEPDLEPDPRSPVGEVF